MHRCLLVSKIMCCPLNQLLSMDGIRVFAWNRDKLGSISLQIQSSSRIIHHSLVFLALQFLYLGFCLAQCYSCVII